MAFCIGSAESYLLDHQGSSTFSFYMLPPPYTSVIHSTFFFRFLLKGHFQGGLH